MLHHKQGVYRRKYRLLYPSILRRTGVLILLCAVLACTYWMLRVSRVSGITPGLVYRLFFNGTGILRTNESLSNILVLGTGTSDHEGSDLTDTMLIVSLHAGNKKSALISIPRDVWSETLKDKVNTAYHYGEAKKKGGGLTLAKVIAEDITGISVPYAIRIDFNGFKRLIDVLGGIDIFVSVPFTDSMYPTEGNTSGGCQEKKPNDCVYETVQFFRGLQHMDGARALVYVRSRHSQGSEGSDFSRNKRQQDVLIALKEKMIRVRSWLTVDSLRQVTEIYKESVDTDMNAGELASAIKVLSGIQSDRFKKIPLESWFSEPLAEEYGGRFVLVPEISFEGIHRSVREQLSWVRESQ